LRGLFERLGQQRAGELLADAVDRANAFLTVVAANPTDRLGLSGLGHADAIPGKLGRQGRLRRAGDEHASVFGPDIGSGDRSVPGATADPIASLEDHDPVARL